MTTSFHQYGLTRIELIAIAFIVGLAGVIGVPMISSGAGEGEARRAQCLANLTDIGRAMAAYLETSGDRWPFIAKLPSMEASRHTPPWPGLANVLSPHLERKTAFHCPSDQRVLAAGSALADRFPVNTTYFETEGTSYEWFFAEECGGKKVGEQGLAKTIGVSLGRADQPILRDFELFHEGDGGGAFNTLYADLKARAARGLKKGPR